MESTKQITEEEIKSKIDITLEEIKDKIPAHMLPLMKETLLKIQMEQIPPYAAMGISQDIIEEMYAQGYHFFQSGKFKDALDIFTVIDQLAGGSEPRFQFALAATHHQMKHYEDAAGRYMYYEILHPTDPLPYYYLYDCFKNLNQPEMALNCLHGASRLAAKIPKFEKLKAKIDLEINHSLNSSSTTGM